MGNSQSGPRYVENNINNGAGMYSNVGGDQIINMGGVRVELHTNSREQRPPLDHDRAPELPAPYDIAVYYLSEADSLLQEIEKGLPTACIMSLLRNEIIDFRKVVICIGLAMDFITKTSPQLLPTSYFKRITDHAFEWSKYLKRLPTDIRGFQIHIGRYLDSESCLKRICLTIFEDYRWRPWLRSVRAYIERSSLSSKVSLRVLSTYVTYLDFHVKLINVARLALLVERYLERS